MASISQECMLFDGSVHENVTMGLDGVVMHEEVIEACMAALGWVFCALDRDVELIRFHPFHFFCPLH
jgi:ABC-type multidrug transport system fused ATPase/permease subunit